MEDRRCKLGLKGRRELVGLSEQGATIRQTAACLGVAGATRAPLVDTVEDRHA